MNKFFNELKRRNVYKVAVAYLITAWLILQVGAVVLPTFEAPLWILKTLTLILILGFPLAILFAWAFEITPEGLKRTRVVPLEQSIVNSTSKRLNFWIIGILSVAVILLLIDSIVLRNGWKAPIFRAVERDAKVVFAVMPFDVQGSGSLDYLKEGVVDLLSTKLDNSGELQSLDPNIILTHVEIDDRNIRNPQYAISKLKGFGANRYVLGSINELGSEITFNAGLYDETGKEINRVQVKTQNPNDLPLALDDLTFLLISKELEKQGKELESLAAISTKNLEALKAFLVAEQYRRKGNYSEALNHLEVAISSDSNFAMAWYQRRHIYGWFTRNVSFTTLVQTNEKVKSLKKSLPQKYQGLQDVYKLFNDQRGKEAMEKINQLIAEYGEDIDLVNMKGEILFHFYYQLNEKAINARPYFEKAYQYQPDNLEPLEHLFQMAFHENDFELLDELMEKFPKESSNWATKKLLWHIAKNDSLDQSEMQAIFLHPSFNTYSMIVNGVQEKSVVPIMEIYQQAINEFPGLLEYPFHEFINLINGREKPFVEMDFNLVDPTTLTLVYSTFLLEDLYSMPPELKPMLKNMTQGSMTGIHPVLYYMCKSAFAREAGDARQFDLYMDSIRSFSNHPDEEIRATAQFVYHSQKGIAAFKNKEYSKAIESIDSAYQYNVPQKYRDRVFSITTTPRLVLAEAKYRLQDYPGALEQLNAFHPLSTPLHEAILMGLVYFKKGLVNAELGNTDEALYYLNLFLELYKDCDERFEPWVEEAKSKREKVFRQLQ